MKKSITLFAAIFFTILHAAAQICGCTDPMATNYNANATVNDGSCTYPSTTISATEIGQLDASLLEGSSTLCFWNGGCTRISPSTRTPTAPLFASTPTPMPWRRP